VGYGSWDTVRGATTGIRRHASHWSLVCVFIYIHIYTHSIFNDMVCGATTGTRCHTPQWSFVCIYIYTHTHTHTIAIESGTHGLWPPSCEPQ